MRDLFLCELRRFRMAALIFAGAHMAVLVFLFRLDDFLQLQWQNHLIVLIAYLVAGMVFALVQFGSYRQPSRWLWLLHRPVRRPVIFSAVSLASACLILFAIGLPVLLAVAVSDYTSARVVDTRHYMLALYAVLLTAAAWLSGSYVMLNGRRSAVVLLVLPLLTLVNLASSFVLLLPALGCLALLAWVSYGAFKPHREERPRGLQLAVTALPLQIGFYLAIVWGFALLYQGATSLVGANPLMMPTPPAGGFTESTRSEGRALFLRGLHGATDPRAAQWRRQIPLLDIANFQAAGLQYPVRHQASNLEPARFKDTRRHIAWAFSHDTMRFEGSDTFTGQPREPIGLHGIGDRTPFPAVPVLPGGPHFMTPQALYEWEPERGTVHRLIELKSPETLARDPKQVGELLYVITNERLIAYIRPVPGAAPGMLEERFSVQLPGAFSDLDRVDVAGLLDGTLISFSFGRNMWKGAGDANQTILHIDGAGYARLIAQRRMNHDFSPLFEHHNWWISPALHGLLALPDLMFDNGMILDKGKRAYSNEPDELRPATAWIAAIAAALLSALFALFWLRRANAGALRKFGWIASALLLGPPALACMLVLQERRPAKAAIDNTTPALAAAA